MRNLAELLSETDERCEPSRLQPAYMDGRQVVLQACLDRTAIIIDGGEARLARLVDLEVDADNLMWSPRSGLTHQELAVSARRGYSRQRRDSHGRPIGLTW